jgi:hypothetical protein
MMKEGVRMYALRVLLRWCWLQSSTSRQGMGTGRETLGGSSLADFLVEQDFRGITEHTFGVSDNIVGFRSSL